LRAAIEADGGNEGALGFAQMIAHGQGGRVAVARRKRRGDALQAPQHDIPHLGIAEGKRTQVLHVVGIQFNRMHQAPIGHQRQPGRAKQCVGFDEGLVVAGLVRGGACLQRLHHRRQRRRVIGLLRDMAQGFGLHQKADFIDIVDALQGQGRHRKTAAVG